MTLDAEGHPTVIIYIIYFYSSVSAIKPSFLTTGLNFLGIYADAVAYRKLVLEVLGSESEPEGGFAKKRIVRAPQKFDPTEDDFTLSLPQPPRASPVEQFTSPPHITSPTPLQSRRISPRKVAKKALPQLKQAQDETLGPFEETDWSQNKCYGNLVYNFALLLSIFNRCLF